MILRPCGNPVYKRRQKRLYFSEEAQFLWRVQDWFYQSVVASMVPYGMLGGSIKEGDSKRLNKLIRPAGSVLCHPGYCGEGGQ